MAAEWHYGQGEEQHGPVPLEELRQLVASRQVQPTDMVWTQGMPDWLPANDVDELFPKQELASQPAAEKLPPVSPEQPSGAASASPLRTAAIGLAAFVVGLVVAASFFFFSSRQNLPERVQLALATLKTDPTDPEANLVVGTYHCFQKDDWKKGLPMLANGSDATLKQLAAAELKKPTVSEEQAKLGDGWWNFAGTTGGRAWKSSQQRAVYWYRNALPHLEGSAKTNIEKKLKRLDEQPPHFEVLHCRTRTLPPHEYYSAQCANLSLEVRRTDKELQRGIGIGLAGLELKGVRLFDVQVQASPDLGGENKDIFAGFMVDYQTKDGYSKRMALSLGAFHKNRGVKLPPWGKGSVPDDFVDLGVKDTYKLDLKEWAPSGWTGRVWFTLVLQQPKPNTFLKAELMPVGKQ
jgi:hypothetical protein